MRTFELDLNKLSDNELETLLELKKKAGSQPQVIIELEKEQKILKPLGVKPFKKRYRKRVLDDSWVKRILRLESFLKKPRKRIEMFKYLKYELKGGGDYKTLVTYLKKVYKKRLIVITQGKTKFYYVVEGDTMLPKKGVKRTKEIPLSRVDWTKGMETDLLNLKRKGLDTKQIKRSLNKKYNINLRDKQVEMKCYNLATKGKRIKPIYVKKHKTKYMKRKTPYLQLQSKYLKKVMEAHHMNSKDAMRYLATKYMENKRSARKAGQQVKAELERMR